MIEPEQDESYRVPTDDDVKRYVHLLDRYRMETGSIPSPLVRAGLIVISGDMETAVTFFGLLLDEYPDLLAYFEKDADSGDDTEPDGESGPLAIDHDHAKPPGTGKPTGGIPEHARGYQ